jgi:glycosyltransferase involved in cell wall biosynthesis
MVFGRPVAATTAGGIPEVVRDGETGLLAPPESPKALGEALVRLLKDADLRRRMAAAGKERAGEFSVERMAERTVAIYEEVILSAARP